MKTINEQYEYLKNRIRSLQSELYNIKIHNPHYDYERSLEKNLDNTEKLLTEVEHEVNKKCLFDRKFITTGQLREYGERLEKLGVRREVEIYSIEIVDSSFETHHYCTQDDGLIEIEGDNNLHISVPTAMVRIEKECEGYDLYADWRHGKFKDLPTLGFFNIRFSKKCKKSIKNKEALEILEEIEYRSTYEYMRTAPIQEVTNEYLKELEILRSNITVNEEILDKLDIEYVVTAHMDDRYSVWDSEYFSGNYEEAKKYLTKHDLTKISDEDVRSISLTFRVMVL